MRRIVGRINRFVAVCLALLVFAPRPAHAIPAFARKYQTSCETCHTVYPKLNPFGEAFRRNGMRFPGDDAEMTKADTVSMGSEAYKKVFPKAVWPSTLPGSIPLALAITGGIDAHPDTGSSAAQADDGAALVMDHIVDEAAFFAGGSFDPKNSFMAEIVIGEDGVEIEHGLVFFNDLIGSGHAFNVMVGRGMPNTSSFAAHSTYVGDGSTPEVSTTALWGREDGTWAYFTNYNLVELNGIAGGRFNWSVGIDEGANAIVRSPQDVYAHLGAKFGGLRLDAEKTSVADSTKPPKPWAENALTLDVTGGHSSSDDGAGNIDATLAMGGGVRAQVGSLELDANVLLESHDNIDGAGLGASTLLQYDELSYVVYPWLVPAVRVDFVSVAPDQGDSVGDLRITPGIAALFRANLKFVLSASLEQANGAPPAGWEAAGGAAEPSSATATLGPELETIHLGMSYAY